jgi:hypothetical protein
VQIAIKIKALGFLLILVTIPYLCFAQNWSLIKHAETHHFGEGNTLKASLWVDSSIVQGTDTIQYLNKVVIQCDSCVSGYHDNLLLINQPGVFGSTITKVQKGSTKLTFPDK